MALPMPTVTGPICYHFKSDKHLLPRMHKSLDVLCSERNKHHSPGKRSTDTMEATIKNSWEDLGTFTR